MRLAHARRMSRERGYAARLTAQLAITRLDDARAGAQRVVDEAAKGEYLRAIRRAQRMVGARVPATQTRLSGVLERHRVSDPRRARAVLTSAMTAARTAGTLDVLTTLALKRKKKAKKKRAKRLVKEWVNDPGSNICEECDALDGQRVNAYSMFRLTDVDQPRAFDYFGGEVEGPPLHPSCRCDVMIDRA